MSVVGKIGKGFAYSLIGRLPAQLKTQRERLGAALGGFARHRQEGGTPIEALDERDLSRLARLALVETLIMGAALLGCIVWGARKVQAGDGLSLLVLAGVALLVLARTGRALTHWVLARNEQDRRAQADQQGGRGQMVKD